MPSSPLVLLHAFNGSPAAWDPVLGPLHDHHDLHVPALPGHRGGPPIPGTGPAGVPALADGIEAAMDGAGLTTVHLAGNSLGGWVALELARRGRARSVVAFSPAGAWRTPADLKILLANLSVSRSMMVRTRPVMARVLRQRHLRRAMLATVMRHGERIPSANVGGFFDDLAGCVAFPRIIEWWRDADPVGFTASELGVPVRIAWAQRDLTLPFSRFGRPLIDALGEPDWLMLPGVGHLPQLDDPALVARTILDVTRAADREALSPA